MPSQWSEGMSPPDRWQAAEPFPTAGRSSGPFLSALREGARESGLWIVSGVVFRVADSSADSPQLVSGIALIGADGWLHGVNTTAGLVGVCEDGTGDWPATQRARPMGVYDTELGRIALAAASEGQQILVVEGVQKLKEMGAELIVVAPSTPVADRVAVSVPSAMAAGGHAYYTSYTLCGPEPLSVGASDSAT